MIRLARPADAEAMLEIYAPIVRDTWISFELTPPSAEEFRRRILETLEHAPWLVDERDGRIAGYAYAKRFWPRPAYQWAVEVTVYVHPEFHRRGIAQALYRSLFLLLRAQGFCKALAVVALPNPASVSFHEIAGFRPIGVFPAIGYKLGAWRDIGWWEMTLGDLPLQPFPPRPLSQLSAEEWRSALRRQGESELP